MAGTTECAQQPARHSLGRSSVVVDFDPDSLWLGDFLLSQRDGQDAALVLRLDFVHIHAIGQREGAHKGPVAALDPVVAPAVLLLLELALEREFFSLIKKGNRAKVSTPVTALRQE